jgi:hypothetical protein
MIRFSLSHEYVAEAYDIDIPSGIIQRDRFRQISCESLRHEVLESD